MKPVSDIINSKSKSVKAIYIYASEKSLFALSENGNCLLCYDLSVFGDVRVRSQTILLNFSWVSIFLDILVANIS